MNPVPFLGYGLGLRSQHWDDVLQQMPTDVDWFEIISENFMSTQGYARKVLGKVRESYPVAMHGVSLSIGSADSLDTDYLSQLRALADWLQPAWVSDHICWTGINHINTHDLLPVPYTEDALAQMVSKVVQVQDYLGRQILLENPSNYMEFSANSMTEWDFICQLLKKADCLLLLDVNNIYVTCFNHNLCPKTYIDAIPAERIGQIHLAGHEHRGSHILDTHDAAVSTEVLDLYAYTVKTKGMKNTMIEWDSQIPPFSEMQSELKRVKQANVGVPLADFSNHKVVQRELASTSSYSQLMNDFQSCVLNNEEPGSWINSKPDFTAQDQVSVYQRAYRQRLFNAIIEDYQNTREAMGGDQFDLLLRTYIEHNPSKYPSLDPYIRGFAEFVAAHSNEHAEIAATEAMTSELLDKPQVQAATLHDLVNAGAENFLKLNLNLVPAAALKSRMIFVADKAQVYRQEVTKEEYQALSHIIRADCLENALQLMYEDDLCSADTALNTIQEILTAFVPLGIFRICAI